jgi:predicted DNA-binding protein
VLTLQKTGKRDKQFDDFAKKLIKKLVAHGIIKHSKEKEFIDEIEKSIEVTDQMISFKIVLPITMQFPEQANDWTFAKKELQKELHDKKQHTEYALFNYIEYKLSHDDFKEDLKKKAKILFELFNVPEDDVYIGFDVKITSSSYQKLYDAVEHLEKELDKIEDLQFTNDAKTRLQDMERRWSKAKEEITQRLRADGKLLKAFRLLLKKPSFSSEETIDFLIKKESIPFFYKNKVQFYLESGISQKLLKALAHLMKMSDVQIDYGFSLTTNTGAGWGYGCFLYFSPKDIAENMS